MSAQNGGTGLFEQARQERRDRYADLTAILDQVAVTQDTAAAIERQVDSYCFRGEHLQLPERVAGLADEADYCDAARLNATEFARGVDHYRHLTSVVNVADPLVAVPGLVDVALDLRLLELAGAYLRCPPLLGFVKLTRSLANGLRPLGTEEFHVDGNSTSLVKAFVHLHDTDIGAGPHQLVRASHRERIDEWDVSARASEGLTVLILNYVVHGEYGGGGARTKVRAADLALLDARQRSAAELLEPVGDRS
ncbi:MAG: hypothetical protein P8R42_27340 [Candidatus Binatia bacterium]|nr:hypothetical protein [Candidatus Binatia bacterium]